MKAGKEPMRTFGDLLQFYQHKTETPADGQPPAAESSPRPQAGEGQGVREAGVETAAEQPPAAETPPGPQAGEGSGVGAAVIETTAEQPLAAEQPPAEQPPADQSPTAEATEFKDA
jgi:hypothetical protein